MAKNKKRIVLVKEGNGFDYTLEADSKGNVYAVENNADEPAVTFKELERIEAVIKAQLEADKANAKVDKLLRMVPSNTVGNHEINFNNESSDGETNVAIGCQTVKPEVLAHLMNVLRRFKSK